MTLFKNPNEIEIKKTISILLYGQPGLWKTTTGLSAPNPVLFDYDGGVHRVHAAHRPVTVQIRNWGETNEAIASPEMEKFETIVIDTAGKMLDFMNSDIIAKSKDKRPNRPLTLKEYGERKQMFIAFIKAVSIMGKNVVFIAHEREEKVGDEKQIRPEIGGSSAGDLIKELDLVGYMEAVGKERAISFDPCEKFYGKNTCSLPSLIKLPAIINDKGDITGPNNFLSNIIETYKNYQIKQTDLTSKYDALLDIIRENIELTTDQRSLNDTMDKISKFEHIFDSKVKAGILLNEKASTLGFKFNKLQRIYEPLAN
jgi:hypothetical protein